MEQTRSVKLVFNVTPELVDRIDRWRIIHMPIQSRAAAVTRILEDRLELDGIGKATEGR